MIPDDFPVLEISTISPTRTFPSTNNTIPAIISLNTSCKPSPNPTSNAAEPVNKMVKSMLSA